MKNFEVESQFGPLTVTSTPNGKVSVANAAPMTVNRVQMTLRGYFEKSPDGWRLALKDNGQPEYHNLMLRRVDNFEYASEAARNKVLAALPAVIAKWEQDNPAALGEADEQGKREALARLKYELAELESKAGEVRAKIKEAEAGLGL